MDLVNFAGFDTYIATNNCDALASSQSDSDKLSTQVAANPAKILVPFVVIAFLLAVAYFDSRKRASETPGDELDAFYDHVNSAQPHYYPRLSSASDERDLFDGKITP